MGKLLKSKIKLDHYLIRFLNLYRLLYSNYSLSSEAKKLLQASHIILSQLRTSNKCLLIGNGPNVKEVNLDLISSLPLDTFTCNHFYKSPFFERLNPTFHTIIDPKIVQGEWNTSMIDIILKKTSSTYILLDIRWSNNPKFQIYLQNERVLWINPRFFPSSFSSLPFSKNYDCFGLNVMLANLSLASNLNYQIIGYCGMNGDGLYREILDMPAHSFFDEKKDSATSSFASMIESLNLHQHFMLSWVSIVSQLAKSGYSVYSLNSEGLLNLNLSVSSEFFADLKCHP